MCHNFHSKHVNLAKQTTTFFSFSHDQFLCFEQIVDNSVFRQACDYRENGTHREYANTVSIYKKACVIIRYCFPLIALIYI